MAGSYRVTGAVAVIRKDGHERYIDQGGVFSAEVIDEANAKHLLSVGLIESIEAEESAETPEGDEGESDTAAEESAEAPAPSRSRGGK